MKLSKPKTKEDLRPPFQYIGDTGWDDWLRRVLVAYDIDSEFELPQPGVEPATAEEIARCEAEMGLVLPDNLKLFLTTLGPLRFEYLHIYSPNQIDFLSNSQININLTPEQEAQCTTIIAVAEQLMDEGGLTDIFGLELASGKIYRCSNYYGGLFEYLPCFDNLIKLAAIDLSWGFFGWDDNHIQDMAEEIAKEELGLLEMEL